MKRSRATAQKGSARLSFMAPRHRDAPRTSARRTRDDDELGQFIPLHYHGQMLADERRMAPFHEAIDRLVPLGSHVVELGGGTGILSFLAAKRARRVTLVERLPHVAAAARRLLLANGASEKVTVVQADARGFVPEEAADVVICEMLHPALLREKQIQVLECFKVHHQARFGRRVPRIIPEATLLAVQPVFHPYDFHGYFAPVPLSFQAGAVGAGTIEMGPPHVYAVIDYLEASPTRFALNEPLTADRAGTINALRFVTKVLVGIFPEARSSTDWHLCYLSLPLPSPLQVQAGDVIDVRFRYDAGGSIELLRESIEATRRG
jgi:protein arginine N-methyltransferase 1